MLRYSYSLNDSNFDKKCHHVPTTGPVNLHVHCSCTVKSRFLEPSTFQPPDDSNQKMFPFRQSNTVILSPIF